MVQHIANKQRGIKKDSVNNFISEIVQKDTFAIIDIGGYFAPKILVIGFGKIGKSISYHTYNE